MSAPGAHSSKYGNAKLTKYIWKLKSNSIKYKIQWKVVDKVYSNAKLTICKLCLTEKLWIINHINDSNILNKNSELIKKIQTFKQVLIKTCKEKTVNLSFMRNCDFVFLF